MLEQVKTIFGTLRAVLITLLVCVTIIVLSYIRKDEPGCVIKPPTSSREQVSEAIDECRSSCRKLNPVGCTDNSDARNQCFSACLATVKDTLTSEHKGEEK